MRGNPPVVGPVGVAVEFFCATGRRSDGDNMFKLLTDAMNRIVFEDDSQIVEFFCRVIRGVGVEAARTQVLVYRPDPVLR